MNTTPSGAATVSSRQEFSEKMARGYLENHVWGTPEQCIAKMRFIADQFHPEEFMMVMRFGNMPKDVSEPEHQTLRVRSAASCSRIQDARSIDYNSAA